MNYSALTTFMSDDSLKKHLAHMKTKKLEHSIIEKSIPEIKGRSVREIFEMNLKRSVKTEIIERLQYIKSHETFFASFVSAAAPCPRIKKFYSSEDSFCYEILELARRHDTGFVYVFSDKHARPTVKHSEGTPLVYINEIPRLAIDLYEHSFIFDYGFERERYLRAAIAHIDLSRLFE